jgi:hypothetical protein
VLRVLAFGMRRPCLDRPEHNRRLRRGLRVQILNVKGRRVLFDVKTQPSSWPAPNSTLG